MQLNELIDKAARQSAKSQAQIACELGIKPARISEWKSGVRKPDAGEIAYFAEKAGFQGIEIFETVAEIEAQLRPEFAEVWQRAVNWRKRSNPPRLRLHQARQKRTREAPKFGAFSFVPSPKRRMAGLVRAVNRALYRTLTQPHRLGNPRHRHAIGVHA